MWYDDGYGVGNGNGVDNGASADKDGGNGKADGNENVGLLIGEAHVLLRLARA